MRKTSRVSRRSFVALITGAASSSFAVSSAKAQETGRTDSDATDAAQHGQTGLTDSDASDLANYGRGGGLERQAYTDTDVAPNSDHVTNSGRGGPTDADTGPNADPAMRGRGTNNGFTDSDPADGHGRGVSNITDVDSSDRPDRGRGPRLRR